MKRNIILSILCGISLFLFYACNDSDTATQDRKDKYYIIISDIHLGDQRSIDAGYGWNLHMKDTLMAFLDYLKETKTCDELIIAGDMIDEWVAPPETLSLADKNGKPLTEREFFREVVKANRPVFDKLLEMKNSGIKLVYIPGNHDMQVTAEDFNEELPGLFVQARTQGVSGMGEYQPDPEIFIEHGHRYDIMNAPYIGKNNVDSITGSILPPGFFVSKLACGDRMRNSEDNPYNFYDALDNYLDDISYNVGWEAIGLLFGHEDVATMTDGMTKTYAFEDYAYNTSKLFYGIDDNTNENDGWSARCKRNKTKFEPTITESLISGILFDFCDKMGCQLLTETDLSSRILVWGHSHRPKMIVSEDSVKQRVYINTGCWIDGEIDGKENTATFCRIKVNKNKEYETSLCRFNIDASGMKNVETIDKVVIK